MGDATHVLTEVTHVLKDCPQDATHLPWGLPMGCHPCPEEYLLDATHSPKELLWDATHVLEVFL